MTIAVNITPHSLTRNEGTAAVPVYELHQDAIDIDGERWPRGTRVTPLSGGADPRVSDDVPERYRGLVWQQTLSIGGRKVVFAIAPKRLGAAR